MSESRIKEIRKAVESRSEELVGLLESFVAIPSENPPGSHLKEAQAWIGDRLTEYDIPFDVRSTSRSDTDHAVIIGTVGSGGRFVYLHGHYDVVPAFAAEQFVPQIRDGSMYGRAPSTVRRHEHFGDANLQTPLELKAAAVRQGATRVSSWS